MNLKHSSLPAVDELKDCSSSLTNIVVTLSVVIVSGQGKSKALQTRKSLKFFLLPGTFHLVGKIYITNAK